MTTRKTTSNKIIIFRKKIEVFIHNEEENQDEKTFISEFDSGFPKRFKIIDDKPIPFDDLKYDLKKRPDDPDLKEYDLTPVEDFGVSLLKGMGWTEGQPIGLSNKGLSQPIEYIPRPQGLGLGAESKLEYLEQKSKFKKQSFSGPIYSEDGKARHYKGIHEKSPLQSGPKVKIKKSKYAGLCGTLISVDSTMQTGKIRIEKTDEIIILGNHEYELFYPSSSESEPSKPSQNCWLSPNLHVRIIDKNIENGKFFNLKGKITSVSKNRCDVSLDNSRVILCGLSQSSLETIVPKHPDAKVTVVIGKFRGLVGTISSRDSKNFIASVKINKKIYQLDYNSICELL